MNKVEFIDTHCHIHDSEMVTKYDCTSQQIVQSAKDSAVNILICVGTDLKSSFEAEKFSKKHNNCYFSIALHPHEAAKKSYLDLEKEMQELSKIASVNPMRLVAIGECGLDYYYHSSEEIKDRQKKLLRLHIELALSYDLAMIFHVREAFDDFFNIIDRYKNITGVVHSFSSNSKDLEGVIKRGFYVGLNGIMTFTKQKFQLDAAKKVPSNRLLLETDAPFLTPAPFRGKMCEPKHLVLTAEFLSRLRGESLEAMAAYTTQNAKQLFDIRK